MSKFVAINVDYDPVSGQFNTLILNIDHIVAINLGWSEDGSKVLRIASSVVAEEDDLIEISAEKSHLDPEIEYRKLKVAIGGSIADINWVVRKPNAD